MSDGQSVRLEGIGNGPTTNEFVMLPITLHSLNDQKVQLHGEVHVVDTLRCGILIGNNILKPSKMEIRWACAEASGKFTSLSSVGARNPDASREWQSLQPDHTLSMPEQSRTSRLNTRPYHPVVKATS